MARVQSDLRYVVPEQLCIGLFVHLDLPWSAHPFGLSSFKIRTQEQINALKALGQPRLRYSPERSDREPPDHVPVGTPPGETDDLRAHVPPQDAPQVRPELSHSEQVHNRMAHCEKQFKTALRVIRGVYREVREHPEAARDGVMQMVDGLAESMLTDADVSLQLMSDSLGHEPPYDHGLNVAVVSMLLARELKVSAEEMRWIGAGALLHDIGLQELPARVVRKDEVLTRSEARLLEDHCRLGADLGRRMKLPPAIIQVIEHHHERVDGSGYPDHLPGPRLPLPVRIVAVVNAYDELCNPAHGAPMRNPHEALSIIYGQQRATFDPMVLASFVRCMGVYPPGTLVQLSDDSLGIVVSVNGSRPLKPMVLVHANQNLGGEPALIDLDREANLMVVRSMLPQHLPDEVRAGLSSRRRIACFASTSDLGPG